MSIVFDTMLCSNKVVDSRIVDSWEGEKEKHTSASMPVGCPLDAQLSESRDRIAVAF